jgi:membrane-bound serine protease (ClpP class)
MRAVLDDQAISPVTARFVERAIRRAEEERAECLILVLDTPGGLVDSTRGVVRDILSSEVPVVVYVAPSGARAASAGVFVTLAAHVSAMAPATNIGAAHPVQVGGLPGAPPQREAEEENGEGDKKNRSTPMEVKSVEDTVAWARSLAELRGRNAEWAARAVRESISVPASEAVKEKAVDLLAEDLDDLLSKIDGREVKLLHGTVRLRTANAEVQTLEMWWGEQALALLTNPNVAFLLLIFGFYGVLFELYSPGWGVAGTLGIVCLLLAFLALAVLPINYVGLALLAVALGMFVAEAFVTSYGALTIAGAVCLVLGGTMLVDSPAGFERVSLAVVAPVALATALVTVFLVGSIVRAHRRGVQTGSDALAGAAAAAAEDFVAEDGRFVGLAQVHGELWKAVSPIRVTAGQSLEIEGRQGLTLMVQPVEPAVGHVLSPVAAEGPESQESA